MDISIIGAGSTGLLLTAILTNHGHDVTCYTRRKDQADCINRLGLTLLPHIQCYKPKARIINQIRKNHELYIICLKQPDLHQVFDDLVHFIPIDKPIIFLQNGMTHINRARSIKHPVFLGVLDHGAKRLDDHTVEHTGKGTIRIGAIKERDSSILNQVTSHISREDFPVIIEKNWEHMLKEKLVVNAVINPLTGLFNVNNGAILNNEHLLFLARNLCEEACSVLELDIDKMWTYVQEVAERTKNNISSMRNDLLNNNKTEIEAITGYLLDTAHINVPFTTYTYHSIKSLESIKSCKS